jgi:hypothetical protein
MVLRGATSLREAFERVGPENLDFLFVDLPKAQPKMYRTYPSVTSSVADPIFSIPDPGLTRSLIRIKEFKYF